MINKDDRKIINQDKEEWIGERPFHWGKSPLKKFVDFEKGKDSAKYTKEYMYEFRGEYPVYSGQTANQGVMGYIKSYDYNIDECLFTTTVGAKAMTISYLKGKFSLSQNCLIMTKKSNIINLKFIYYFLIPLFNYEKALIPSHMQPSLRISDLKSYSILEPPLKEQNFIVKFLDTKASEIDTLIEDKEKLIALLEEKRQAIITEAVTKGLDPDVKMKVSGVEWIGEFPEHWEMKKIKYVVSIQNGREILKEVDEESTDYQKYRVYGSGGFFKWTNDYLYNGESVLFGRKGTLGKPLYVNGPFWTVDTMYYSKMKKVKAKYFYFVLLSFPWEIITTQTALPSIVSTDLSNENWCFPPIKEQNVIINYLDKVDGETTSNVKLLKRQIELLKEYRQALIYEAVTGKIDVQEMLKETEQEEVSSS